MAEKQKYSCEISPKYDVDVLVVGGGPAGCTAAMAAAREGAKVLLIEACGALGGMGTSGLVTSWCPFSDGEKILYRGLAEEVLNRTKKGMPHVNPAQLDWVPIDPELLKRVYDELLKENGAKVILHTRVAAVQTSDDRSITSVVLANKAGLTACSARVFIDATGDGDIAAWAGAEYMKDEGGPGRQHCALYFHRLTKRPSTNIPACPPTSRPVRFTRLLQRKKYPLINDINFCFRQNWSPNLRF